MESRSQSEIKVLAGLVSPRPLSLACRWPSFPCFVFTWLSLCAHTSAVSLCVLISFYNNTRYIRLRPTLMTPFNLFTSLKTSNIVTLWGTGSQGFNIWILWGYKSAHNTLFIMLPNKVSIQLGAFIYFMENQQNGTVFIEM